MDPGPKHDAQELFESITCREFCLNVAYYLSDSTNSRTATSGKRRAMILSWWEGMISDMITANEKQYA